MYFSGHGIFQNDALLCCSDFDHSRPSSTSISNSEIDDLLRSVGPKVAVKVIDACQSGSPYIKDAGAGFEKALTTSSLKSFICMASSRQDQSSYASVEASNFTKNWIDAALEKTVGNVLYRDIQAALADAFVSNPEQTPFFVQQGTGLELFSVVTDEMQKISKERGNLLAAVTPKTDDADLIEAEINKLDAMYITFQEACYAVTNGGEKLIEENISEPLVARFYEKKVSLDGKLGKLPRIKDVAQFAEEQKWPKNYFVNIAKEAYEVKVTPNPYIGSYIFETTAKLYGVKPEEDRTAKTETRYRPSSLSSTQALPFEVAEIAFEATKHSALKAFTLYIGIVNSLTEVMVLSAVVRLSQKGWEERAPDLANVQWKYQNHLWKDVVQNPRLLWEEPLKYGQSLIKSYLEEFKGKPNEDEAQEKPAK